MVTTERLKHLGTPDRFSLSGISWETYERLRDELDAAGRRIWITYDNGDLEFELPIQSHETTGALVHSMISFYLLEAGIPFMPLGHTTWKRPDLLKGLEADDCYYVQNVDLAESVDELDLAVHPPPDLAVEIEVTDPHLAKLPIYASLGISELWYIKGKSSVQFLKLETGGYVPIEQSIAAPSFTPELLSEWLHRRVNSTEFKTVQAFRTEVLSKLQSK